MLKLFTVNVAIVAAGLAVFAGAAVPTSAKAQGYDRQHREAVARERSRQHYADRTRGRYNSRRCGSGNGAVGTVAGGAGGALLGNALGGGTLGTIAGGVGGALVGRTLDKQNTRDKNRNRYGC